MRVKKKVGVERSVGAVIFRNQPNNEPLFLLLQHNLSRFGRDPKIKYGHWDFPKGHIEHGEKSEETLRREVYEESGISRLDIIPGWKETIKYFVGPKGGRRLKFVAYFIAETKTKKIKISFEHRDFAWLPYKAALERITYKNSKNVLNSAESFLKQ